MSKAKVDRTPRERATPHRPNERDADERAPIVPDPPPKRPAWMILSVLLLAGWIVFLLVMAYGMKPTP